LFLQVFVDQLRDDVVAITRHNPHTHVSVVLVARTAFQSPELPEETGYIRPVTIDGLFVNIYSEFSCFNIKTVSWFKLILSL